MRKSVRTVTLCVLLALTVLALPTTVFADTINVGDGWHPFSWLGGVGATQSETPFSFTTASATSVTVTDAYVYGDRFELYDNGVLVGATSAVSNQTVTPWTSDPATAIAHGYSNATFSVGAGSHSLVLKTIQVASGYDSGAGYVRVGGDGTGSTAGSGSAPEPGTLALLGIGMTGLAARRFRRGLRKVFRRDPAPATV